MAKAGKRRTRTFQWCHKVRREGVRRRADSPAIPMTRANVERKFRSNLGSRALQEDTGAVLEALWALDRTEHVRSVAGKLALRT
jgi:hypothetical protein